MNVYILISAILNILFLVVIIFQRISFKKYKKAQKDLEKQRDGFMAMIIHELRSPLAVIQGSADLLIAEVQNLTKEQIFNTLTQIKNSAHSLLGVVNDLLDLAKLESGKVELLLKKNNINALLKDEYNYYFGAAQDRGVQLILDADESIPEFTFDFDKIKQVLNNFISNAMKFTDPGESIFIFSKKKDNCVEIIVADTGKGVPEEKQAMLFNKFAQVQDSTHKKDKGTGLGLAIAKGIVEAHKGNIYYEKNMPKGSKFIFTIPIE